MAAPQLPFTKALPSTTPLSIPYGCLLSSLYPAAKVIGACMIVAPAALAASTTSLVLASMLVLSAPPALMSVPLCQCLYVSAHS